MTADRAIERVRRLLALAEDGSGTTDEEARTAALTAARLIIDHGLLDRGRYAVDLGHVTRLVLKVLELEGLLAEERAARVAEVRRRDTMPSRRRA